MKIDILKVAKLANLEISASEKNELEEQLSSILDYIEKLNELKTDDIEDTSQVTNLENVQRNDISSISLDQKDSLKNASKQHEGFFEVDAILEQSNP